MFPIFIGKVENGKLILQEQDRFDAYLVSLGKQPVNMVVRTWRKPRSIPENKYYFGVVVKLLSEHTGYTPEEIHEFLKSKFLSKIIVLAGKDERIPRSSTTLSTIEWEKWMTEIREWSAQELGCIIPDPNEVDL